MFELGPLALYCKSCSCGHNLDGAQVGQRMLLSQDIRTSGTTGKEDGAWMRIHAGNSLPDLHFKVFSV